MKKRKSRIKLIGITLEKLILVRFEIVLIGLLNIICIAIVLILINMPKMPKKVCVTTWETEVITTDGETFLKDYSLDTEITCEDQSAVSTYSSLGHKNIYDYVKWGQTCIIKTPKTECELVI